jgi:hypothetical protein
MFGVTFARVLRLNLLTALSILALPASALADSQVRFLHAVPMVGEATLSADGQPVGSAGFAEVSDPVTIASGPTELVLEAPGGVTLRANERLADGASYTIVAFAKGKAAELVSFRNGDAKPGKARLRMIHGAPELGEADIQVDGKVVAEGAAYTDATRYWGLEPGRSEVAVLDPATGEEALPMQEIPLVAGTATSAYVVGSAGEATRAVLVSDATLAPAAPPETGLGGSYAEGGPNWLLALAAALAVGGAAALVRRRLQDPRHRKG